jgi:phosphoribosylglycinamide formyltransferase-1
VIRLGVLGSTRGSNLSALTDAIKRKKLHASIEVVISNKPDALILERAREQRLRAQFIDSSELSREEYDRRVSAALHAYQVELIVLIGYMRILSAEFVREWQGKIINVHPSLLPAFAGKMDLDVHAAVLAAGVSETGCTVHHVTEEVDAGPIVLQKRCEVLSDDTAETLKARVQQLEGEALIEAIGLYISSRGLS